MKRGQVRNRVIHAVIAAEVAKGHLKWKVSDIARQTGVSRPLIYYHFGKTKKNILKECLNVLAEDYYGLSEAWADTLQKSESTLQSLLRTRGILNDNPSIGVLYQRARAQGSFVSHQLIEIEERYQRKLKQNFPSFSDDQIRGVHALFHGMITAPFLSANSLAAALELLKLPVRSERTKQERA